MPLDPPDPGELTETCVCVCVCVCVYHSLHAVLILSAILDLVLVLRQKFVLVLVTF